MRGAARLRPHRFGGLTTATSRWPSWRANAPSTAITSEDDTRTINLARDEARASGTQVAAEPHCSGKANPQRQASGDTQAAAELDRADATRHHLEHDRSNPCWRACSVDRHPSAPATPATATVTRAHGSRCTMPSVGAVTVAAGQSDAPAYLVARRSRAAACRLGMPLCQRCVDRPQRRWQIGDALRHRQASLAWVSARYSKTIAWAPRSGRSPGVHDAGAYMLCLHRGVLLATWVDVTVARQVAMCLGSEVVVPRRRGDLAVSAPEVVAT